MKFVLQTQTLIHGALAFVEICSLMVYVVEVCTSKICAIIETTLLTWIRQITLLKDADTNYKKQKKSYLS